jgi:hypothetical protein
MKLQINGEEKPFDSPNPTLAALQIILLIALLLLSSWAHAQYELPDEIFQRTLLIRSGSEQATAFKFDQGSRIYLVTTRRLAKNLPLTGAIIELWDGSTWNTMKTVRTLFPASKDIDLAILETSESISKPYIVVKTSEVLTEGQKVWFMGSFPAVKHPTLPAGLPKTSRPIFANVPAITVGTISAIDPIRPDAFAISFQHGFNSPLLAPGPIVYWSPVHRDFEVLGLIMRDKPDATKVVSDKKVLRGYSIDIIVDTIRGAQHS